MLMPINWEMFLNIERSLEESSKNLLSQEKLSFKDHLCVFNNSSLSNYMRRIQPKKYFLDRSKIRVRPTIELEDKLKEVYSRMFGSQPSGSFMIDGYYPDDTGQIYGTFMLTALIDETKQNQKVH